MKELKKFHLKPEQELTDEEMKQIKVKAGDEEYVTCYAQAENKSQCQVDKKCYADPSTEKLPGKCTFGRMYDGAEKDICYCSVGI